ncbi:MAG: hypothetical protein WAZ14_04195 [Patescibacteria group bacterium]
MSDKYVYNLIFPDHVDEFKIGDYTFRRTADYVHRVDQMQHLINVTGTEHSFSTQTGTHALTATVHIPADEKPGTLSWSEKIPNATQLLDILLLLTLFTKHNVFAEDEAISPDVPIIQDHRSHAYGNELRLALPSDLHGDIKQRALYWVTAR